MFRNYHAVSIRPASQCCQAVKNTKDVRYLSTEAPTLPVSGCSMPTRCRCKYRHFSDRREDFRRDSDFGMPDRPPLTGDRRERVGRRASDAA